MEIAALLFAGVSAAAAAMEIWKKTRDQVAAAKMFDATIETMRADPDTMKAAKELTGIAPPEIIKSLERRADKCWTAYRDVLGGQYLPGEVDDATNAVQACVCRELRRVHSLNAGKIPKRWKGQWKAYACEQKKKGAPAVANS